MATYIWAWADEEGSYINESDSLGAILREVLETYFYEYEHLSITESTGEFCISIITEGNLVEYECDAVPDSVREFLERRAALLDRPDRFDIWIK